MKLTKFFLLFPLLVGVIFFTVGCNDDEVIEPDYEIEQRGKMGTYIPPNSGGSNGSGGSNNGGTANPYGTVFPSSFNCSSSLSPSDVEEGPCFYAQAMIEKLNQCSKSLVSSRFGDGFSGPPCVVANGCEQSWELSFQSQSFPSTSLPPVCTTGCPPAEEMHFWNSDESCTGSNLYVIEDWVMDGQDVANALTIALQQAEAAAAAFSSECENCPSIVPYSIEWEVTYGVCDHPCEFSICPESGMYYISNGPNEPINRLTPKIKFCCVLNP